MTLFVRDVVAVLEGLYPLRTAQSWDRVGLVTGDPDQPVRRIHVALDPTLAVIAEAVEAQADLLVTHHPLLLRGVHGVATTTAKGASVTSLVVADVALYVAHTNADVAVGGVSDALGAAAGLTDLAPLAVVEGEALGRVGRLPEPVTLADFATGLHRALPGAAGGIRVSGPPDAPVRTAAVLGGSGDDLFDAVRECGADVYVTADLRHHPALEAREEARGGPPYLVDAGHWASEAVWLPRLRDALLDACAVDSGDGPRVEVHTSTVRTDPWDFVVGAVAPGGMP
jgi:dinuclear metal center YbgI/SA1388 family protein